MSRHSIGLWQETFRAVKMVMHKSKVSKWFASLFILAMLAFCYPQVAAAQLTSTNAVTLITDNVTNARDTIVPIAIGALVLFIGIAAATKFWRRIFSK